MPDVAARVGTHPNIVVNFASTPIANDEGWWVVDDWVGERTLGDHLGKEPWPREQLPRLLLDIRQGLDALHKAFVVFRELAPSRVLMADKGGRAVLTDFELAKLLDGGPSVSSRMAGRPLPRAGSRRGNRDGPRGPVQLGATHRRSPGRSNVDSAQASEVLDSTELPKRL